MRQVQTGPAAVNQGHARLLAQPSSAARLHDDCGGLSSTFSSTFLAHTPKSTMLLNTTPCQSSWPAISDRLNDEYHVRDH